MENKRKVLIGTLIIAGIVLVLAGVTLSAFTADSGNLSFLKFPSVVTANKAQPTPSASAVPSASSSTRPATPTPSTPPNQATYKVTGTIVLSPSSPVCSAGKPCASPVANHEIDIVGSVPAKAYTNAQGQFTLNLPSGHYQMTLNPQVGPGGQSWPFTVTNQPLNLPLTADSGIR